jgi:hypothetical protein
VPWDRVAAWTWVASRRVPAAAWGQMLLQGVSGRRSCDEAGDSRRGEEAKRWLFFFFFFFF